MLALRKLTLRVLESPAPPIIVATFAIYVVLYASLFQRLGAGVGALAVLPTIVGGWYFGVRGGLTMALVAVLTNTLIFHVPRNGSGVILGDLALILVAVAVGTLRNVSHERGAAIRRLKQLEKERLEYTHFLELLERITRQALETESLEPAFGKLLESIAELFQADGCYLSYWDEAKQASVPIAAYGSMSKSFPAMQVAPGSRTPTAAIPEEGRALAIPDLPASSRIDTSLAADFQNQSLLALPLIVQKEKFGVLHLGYNTPRVFEQEEINRAEMAAKQIALALSKVRLLEEAQKQVKQLTALHEVALASTQADSVDQLIEHVTAIIGRNLFPDNFGILLRDEEKPVIHAHPSYRFHARQEQRAINVIPLGTGITGLVALTGILQRLGDVQSMPNYISMDDYIHSELCVPIQLKENILGVINAESSQKDAFSPDDERLLAILAGQLATAIEQLRTAEAERLWLGQLAHSNELISILAGLTTQIEKTADPAEVVKTLGAEFSKLNITSVLAHYIPKRQSFTLDYQLLSDGHLEALSDSIGFPLTVYSFPVHQIETALDKTALAQAAVLEDAPHKIRALVPLKFQKMLPGILGALGVSEATFLFHLPLIFEERLLGVLWLWGADLMPEDLQVLSVFAKQVAITLENARLFQEVQSLALTDPLTGLHNRRNLFEVGRLEFARSQRMNRPICCMMLDLDHFKTVNDTYGHQAGDKVLQEFARICKASVREIDLVGRYGGEELIILLPETTLEATQQVAQRLRNSIASTPVLIDQRQIQVTVSIGLSRMDENTPNLETLIARADQAMYLAKHHGRNRVALGK